MDQYNAPYEMDWDAEIEHDGAYTVLPEGDYHFIVRKFDRARHNGSEKLPPCLKAILTLDVESSEASGTVQTNLFLHSTQEWKLCQFFTAIGKRKKGERLRMNWNEVVGASGWCRLDRRSWTGSDGRERESNEVKVFYDPAEYTPPDFQPSTGSYPSAPRTQWKAGDF
ncbi:MAG: DUF669 domain-containing protein [Oscillibacter sp.]|nr:DUF669 domain-containing protein [Oscillibacter sp.]